MTDGSDERPRRYPVRFDNRTIALRFSDTALAAGLDVIFYRGPNIPFYIKYSPAHDSFILNDRHEDVWGEELFVPCPRTPAGDPLTLTIVPHPAGSRLRAPGHEDIALADRFDLAGEFVAVAWPVIAVAQDEDAATDTPDPQLSAFDLTPVNESPPLQHGLEVTNVAESGFFVEGWVDDRRARTVAAVLVDQVTGQRKRLSIGRVRRPDVDAHLNVARPGEYGFRIVGLGHGERQLATGVVHLLFADGTHMPLRPGSPARQDVDEFFTLLMSLFGGRAVIGNLTARSFGDLDAGLGAAFGTLYRRVAEGRRVTFSTSFGRQERRPRISLVCVLYGLPDFLYLLVAQFARFGPLEDVEFLFVNNSPEIEEALLRDAEIAAMVFGVEITVIGLNKNSGFSHANNVGAQAARAPTIAFVNPDVFPRDRAAIDRLRTLAAQGTGRDLYSGKLYYADGSVMHEGMYFDEDRKLSTLCGSPVWTVEHYRKGFPDRTAPGILPVPAVSGAFMVIDRDVFRELGGFSTAFVYGHYEDADLCLRVRQAGGRVLLDPSLAYWHYEGMGSVKRPEHTGSGLYNRWYFARTWGQRLAAEVHG